MKRMNIYDGETISFGKIQWLYRDGMDRIQYDEVIPTQQDSKVIGETFNQDGTLKNPDDFVSLDDLDSYLKSTDV